MKLRLLGDEETFSDCDRVGEVRDAAGQSANRSMNIHIEVLRNEPGILARIVVVALRRINAQEVRDGARWLQSGFRAAGHLNFDVAVQRLKARLVAFERAKFAIAAAKVARIVIPLCERGHYWPFSAGLVESEPKIKPVPVISAAIRSPFAAVRGSKKTDTATKVTRAIPRTVRACSAWRPFTAFHKRNMMLPSLQHV